jgi:hypothetical protein
MRRALFALYAAALVVLASCGGGSSAEPAASATTTPTATAQAVASPGLIATLPPSSGVPKEPVGVHERVKITITNP